VFDDPGDETGEIPSVEFGESLQNSAGLLARFLAGQVRIPSRATTSAMYSTASSRVRL
jgi:hypothetical protein